MNANNDHQISMLQKTCIVTGATAGIGKQTALELAGKGATVILVGRTAEKCQRAIDEISQQVPAANIDFLVGDLSSLEQIRALAAEFQRRYARLDVLVNNAGALFLRRQLSVDGFEMTFATNHLNYFLLTNLLLDTLKASAPARIVNVASKSHLGSALDFDDLQNKHGYALRKAYGRSKFANVIFTYELARRLENTGVTANVLHPGLVVTNMGMNNGIAARIFQPLYLKWRGIPVEEGARTVVYLASSPEVEGVTGKYFYKQKAIDSDPGTYVEEAWQQLWDLSEQMAGLADS